MTWSTTHRFSILSSLLVLGTAVAGCGGDEEAETCTVGTSVGCNEGRVCEPVTGSEEPQCFAPLYIEGRVFDSATGVGIMDARIVALDVNSFARSDVTFSGLDGTYSLPISVERNAEGVPVTEQVTLRVAASGYQPFPRAPRTALPIDLGMAGETDEGDRVVMNAATDVALIELEGDTTGFGTITGVVDHDTPGGVLVVAEQGGTAVSTAITDFDGDFTLYNVPMGSTVLDGYREGVNVEQQTVEATGDVTDVVLAANGEGLATVSGSVNIVNAPGGLTTSVILGVESTFVENAARAEAPAGLVARDVASGFTIENVPPGRYVVLAAFENDDLVRDPDEGIAGTEIVHIEVPEGGGDVPLDTSFKVTEALAVVGPGAETVEEISTAEPTFEWADDSSEDGYEIYVYDAFGNEVYMGEEAGVSGSATVTHRWTGAALEEGMLYQFRAYSYRAPSGGGRSYISATEDLRGVFVYRSGGGG